MTTELCILIPTFDRYLPVARWTISRIRKEWKPCPPIFLCGSTADDSLPLVVDPDSWMQVAHSACEDLWRRGFRWVYLILDDHPPVGPCLANHLNATLPALAAKLAATTICLESWGRNFPLEGEALDRDCHHLGRNSPDYHWKFALHPGLWSLSSLIELLENRITRYPLHQQTAWNFERHRGPEDGEIPRHLLQSTYRVSSAAMSRATPRSLLIEAGGGVLRAYRAFLFAHFGKQAMLRHGRNAVALWKYIPGPYPMYHCGAMRGGRVNAEFLSFLRWSASWEITRSWKAAAALVGPGHEPAAQP